MGAIDARLERGVAIFRRAGDDTALLGAALLAFHGGLEAYLDEELAGQPDLGAAERELIAKGLVRDVLSTEYEARLKLHPKGPPVP